MICLLNLVRAERKANVLSTNALNVNKYGKQLTSSSKTISDRIEEYLRAARDLQAAIESQAAHFTQAQSERISQASSQVDKDAQGLREHFQALAANEEEEGQLFSNLSKQLESAQAAFEETLEAWGEGVRETVRTSCGEASSTVAKGNADIGKAVDSLQLALENIMKEARTFLQEQKQLIGELKDYANSQATAEIARLKKQNELLAQLVVTERNRANAAKDELVRRVTGLLDTFLQERDESLKAAARDLQKENDAQAKARSAESAEHGKTWDATETRFHSFDGILQQNVRDNKRKRDMISKVCRCCLSGGEQVAHYLLRQSRTLRMPLTMLWTAFR